MTNVRRRRDVSSAESCGFVTYLLSFPIAAAYVAWAFVPDHILHSAGITYYPPKSLAVHLPILALALFVAVPFLYAGLNFLSAPSASSLDTLWDGHAKEQERESYLGMVKKRVDTTATEERKRQVDADDENDFAGRIAFSGTKGTAGKLSGQSKHISKDVPEICDIDVRLINEMQIKSLKQR